MSSERLFVDEDAPPLSEVSSTIASAGAGGVALYEQRDTVDVTVQPVREESADEDVTVRFTVGGCGEAELSLAEDDALALVDSIRQALEVESFE
ncbi:hypothetical protein ACOZ4I_17335 (plasmid) [Haloarcula salina]|uniref:hypothetical protein n=1 Tax=Haloarcula salina TaxID=1429914 RepID=UPI003C6F7CB7